MASERMRRWVALIRPPAFFKLSIASSRTVSSPAMTRVYERQAVARERGGRYAPAMSATQSEHNPLICRYFREACLSGKEPARRCGTSHSRIYVARTQGVRSNNAEKISRGMAQIPDLSEQVRLELKAEIIEHHETTWGIRAHRPGT